MVARRCTPAPDRYSEFDPIGDTERWQDGKEDDTRFSYSEFDPIGDTERKEGR